MESLSSMSLILTTNDDFEGPVPFDLLDDDPWIKSKDLTPSRSIRRCNSY